MLGDIEEEHDPPYLVPTHLRESQTIGPLPVRSFYVVLLSGLMIGAPLAVLMRNVLDDAVGYWFMLLPVIIFSPFALWFLNPPAEYGLWRLVAFLAVKLWRNTTWRRLPPRHELAEANGLRAFLRVINNYRRRETLGLADQPDLAKIEFRDGAVWLPVGNRLEPRAIFRVPTVNLETASAVTRHAARAQWGAIVNALPHPIQIVIRSVPVDTMPVLKRIAAHGLNGRRLAEWLGAHLRGAGLVDRQRYFVVPAENAEQLDDRCTALESSMRRIGLEMERIVAEDTIRRTLSAFLTPRLRQTMPGVVDVGSSNRIVVDGQHIRAFDVGELPPTIFSDWAAPLFDGDLALDCSLDIEPLDLTWAKLKLDARFNQIGSSSPSPGRQVALEQISGLRMAYERRQTLPMDLTLTIVVRAETKKALDRQTKRLKQRARDLGIGLRIFRWEMRGGWLAVLPIRRKPMPRRGLPVETGTVARTYPHSSGTLQIEGGVPFGVAASSPVTFTVAQPRRRGRKGWRHMCWYGNTGSGKSYSCKCYLSREHFANGLRIFGIDQDEGEEFSGRFCRYLDGSRVPIRSLEEARAFRFDDVLAVPNPRVVIWNLHESPMRERGLIFAELKDKLCAHLLATKGQRAALVIDEAVTVTRQSKEGTDALYDLATRGRHYTIELHTLTQLASAWFKSDIGQAVQGTSANQWYGQIEDRERDEMVKNGVKFSREELDLIERAGQGEGLLVTGGRRVWVNLYGHTSDDEFAAFNTDSDDEATDERRNGHLAPFALAAD